MSEMDFGSNLSLSRNFAPFATHREVSNNVQVHYVERKSGIQALICLTNGNE